MGVVPNKDYPVYRLILKRMIEKTPKLTAQKNNAYSKQKSTRPSKEEDSVRLDKAIKAIFGVSYVRGKRGPKEIREDDIALEAYRNFYVLKKSNRMTECVRFAAQKELNKLETIEQKSFIRRISRKVEALHKRQTDFSSNPVTQHLLTALEESGIELDFESFNEQEIQEQVSAILECLIDNGLLNKNYISSDIISKIRLIISG